MSDERSKRSLSRRGLLGSLAGASVAAAAVAVKASPVHASRALVLGTSAGAAESSGGASTGSSRLAVGSRIGPWTVTAAAMINGALAVTLVLGESDAPSDTMHLDVLARDPGDPVEPPASTEHLALYVWNTGDGATATRETHAKMAREIARQLAAAGEDASIEVGLLTRRAREVQHREALFTSRAPASKPDNA